LEMKGMTASCIFQESAANFPRCVMIRADHNPFESDNRAPRRWHVGVTVIERAKLQAQVLVPLVKALQAELGEERANALVRKRL
jgi:hypothetical protein